MANALVTVVRGFIDDTTDAISNKVGPLMESFTRKTGTLVSDNANAINDADSSVKQGFDDVVTSGRGDAGGDLPPGAGPSGSGVGGRPSDPIQPRPPGGADPVGTQGVGPCGKAGEPVDVVTGQYVAATTDLELPGVLPLVLRRAYASGYRDGRLLGPGWSSTLDTRVQIESTTIRFLDDDCRILEYPHPAAPGQSVLPHRGPRLPLSWDRELDEIRIEDRASGRTWHFTTLGAVHTGLGQIRPLTAIRDRNGNRIVILRDDQGLPTEVQHSGGYRIAVDTGYVAGGFRLEALRILGSSTDQTHGPAEQSGQRATVMAYQYDPYGRLAAVVNTTGVPFVYEHDAHNRIAAWIDRLGFRFEYTYDSAGRVVRTTGDGGCLSGSFAYDPDGRKTVYTNSLGFTTEFHYDRFGHITKSVNALGHATTTEYDRHGHLLATTDPLGNTTRQTVDDSGNLLAIERPDGTTVTFDYNALNAPVRVSGPKSAVWQYAWDECGNLLNATDPEGGVTIYAYGERGQLTQVTDPLGNTTTIETDRAGLPVSTTDPVGGRWSATRDSQGRVVSLSDPLGATTIHEFDGEGRPRVRRFADGTLETWVWDANGTPTAYTDTAGHTTTFDVGPFRQITARTDPDGARYTFTHDSELQLLEVTNPSTLTWTYTYDPIGNVIGEQDFDDRRLAYSHDPAGRVVRRVNGAGQGVHLVRDQAGRVVEQRTDDGEIRSFAYDAAGLLCRATGPGCELVFDRDRLGRVLRESVDGRTVATTFDKAGRRTSRTTPSGHTSTWNFDAGSRPLSLHTGNLGQIFFGHDAAGRESHRWIGPDTALTRERDQLGRLTGRRLLAVEGPDHDRRSRVANEHSWSYRSDGVPEETTDTADGARHIDLDPLGRVTAVHAATWSETYAYDQTGNLLHAADSRTPESPTAGNRHLTGTRLRRAGRTHYDYDAQGRLVRTVRRTLSGSYKTWTFAYDAFDRLTDATNPAGEHWHYRYDPLGRRVGKHRLGPDGNPAEQTRFAWDGTVLAEMDHSRAQQPLTTTLTWDHEPDTWTPVAQTQRTFRSDTPQQAWDEQFYAIVTDLAGTPTELLTANGNTAWRRHRGLWGGPLPDPATQQATTACPLRFPGQFHDEETGLDYNYHRYYDSETGRYTCPDPLGLLPAPNHYTYVDNPQWWLDPLGLARKTPVDVAVATIKRARAGTVSRTGGYHGRLDPDVEKSILSNPDGVYESSGGAGRLLYHKGGDLVITEGPGSSAGKLITSYGESGPRGKSGAAIFGGDPTDPGMPITPEQITTGQVRRPDGSFEPPATELTIPCDI
ncbi:MAG TPA: DUF6531 domain-containing protein [Actinocrinis sp.]|nr:DUF6531 domain-containing protein [Actinocrinis sp.]